MRPALRTRSRIAGSEIGLAGSLVVDDDEHDVSTQLAGRRRCGGQRFRVQTEGEDPG